MHFSYIIYSSIDEQNLFEDDQMAEPLVCKNNEEELYHGTSIESAQKILKEGFVPDKKYNWQVKSKEGFVYLSKAYAPFYAMNAKSRSREKRAIVGTCVPKQKLYPEDDFLMNVLGKPVYTQEELDKVDLERYKWLWRKSLEHMGNASAKPKDVRVVGIQEFDAGNLIMTCDPSIGPENYAICGKYYEGLTKWLYEGKNHMDFPRMHEFLGFK